MLTGKLLVARAEIFNRAPDGLDRLREPDSHFVQPKSGEAFAPALKRLSSRVRTFVEDRCQPREVGLATRMGRCGWLIRVGCDGQRIRPGTKEQFAATLRVVTGLHVGRPRVVDGERDEERPTAIYGLRLRKAR